MNKVMSFTEMDDYVEDLEENSAIQTCFLFLFCNTKIDILLNIKDDRYLHNLVKLAVPQ